MKLKELVICKAGKWTGSDAKGNPVVTEVTVADLDKMSKNFNAEDPPHLIIGHTSDYKGKTRIPALGKVVDGLVRRGNELVAIGVEMHEKLVDWIRQGFYTQRSVEMTKGKDKILNIALLGAAAPAVKGMTPMDEVVADELLADVLAYAQAEDVAVIEFSEAEAEANGAQELAKPVTLDEVNRVEDAAKKDTMQSLTQTLAEFLRAVEECMSDDTKTDKLFDYFWTMRNDVTSILSLQSSFQKKIEAIEEGVESSEMADKSGWREFAHKIKTKIVGPDNSAQKLHQLMAQVADLSRVNAELSQSSAAATLEVSRLTEQLQTIQTSTADAALASEIAMFCDAAIATGKMTKPMRETDEPIMVKLAKADRDSLKAFQQKYETTIVQMGEHAALSDANDVKEVSSHILDRAAAYVKAHRDQFVGMSDTEARSRAMFLHHRGEVRFDDPKPVKESKTK